MCNITKCFIGFIGLAYSTFWIMESLICATLHCFYWFGLFDTVDYLLRIEESLICATLQNL